MVKRPGLGKRKRFPQAEEAATDSTQPLDESVSTQSASVTTQSAKADYDSQAEDIERELATQERTQQSDEPPHKKKLVRLTDEQEEAMTDWLKDNTVLYNKGKKEYKKEAHSGLHKHGSWEYLMSSVSFIFVIFLMI